VSEPDDLLENWNSLYERLEQSNYDRRTSLQGRNNYLLDVSRASAAQRYRQNLENLVGNCRSTSHPIVAIQ